MEVDPNVLQESVDYIAEAQPILQKVAETESKVAALAPTVVDALIKAGHVDAEIREKAIQNLQDPVKALEALSKLAAVKTTEKAASAPPSMGSAQSSGKSASAAVNGTGKMKESDRVFFERFGLL